MFTTGFWEKHFCLQMIEHDENLSDKEVFPTQPTQRQQAGIPSIGKLHVTFFA